MISRYAAARFVVGIVLAVAITIFMSGCATGRRDISQTTGVAHLVGQELTTRVDMVVFKEGKVKFIEVFGRQGLTPRRDEMKEVPFGFYGIKVVGVLDAGTKLKVTRIIENNYFTNTTIDPYAVAIEGPRHGEEVNLTCLVDHTFRHVEFDPEKVAR